MILVCAFLVKALTSGESLSEYAEKNPEIAYQVGKAESESAVETVSDDIESTATSTAGTSYILCDGFSSQPLPADVISRITGSSYPADGSALISLDDLSYLTLLYVNFDGQDMEGEMICNKAIAKDLLEIFKELYDNQYPIERIELVDVYQADDESSMEHNNTSCFNYRMISGSNKLSKHSAGLAVDLNPLYNPAVSTAKDGSTKVEPATASAYVDRSQNFAHKIDTSDLAYQVFTRHGFTWGGNWHSKKDYQHFEKSID
ncbi:MAG: M15 family metallopeptidase [Lachnospiraceae bacterium]|nr:M15 family metallopeptidase [Lachnospiraceae bacterium]